MLGGWQTDRRRRRPDPRRASGPGDGRHPLARSSSAARALPARGRLRQASRPGAVAEAAGRPAQPDPLPLRLEAAAHPRGPRGRERAPARAAARRCSAAPSRCGGSGTAPATSSTTDLESGYVRILQEMIAAGWSDAEVAAAVRELLAGWYRAAGRGRATRGGARGEPRRPFTPDEVAALMGLPFLGAEEADPARRRRIGPADAFGPAQGRPAAPVRSARRRRR